MAGADRTRVFDMFVPSVGPPTPLADSGREFWPLEAPKPGISMQR